MTRASLPTPEYLSSVLLYDSETGRLVWRHRADRSWNTRFAGREAFQGLDRQGYRKANIGGITLRGHRVVWAIAYGRWPDLPLDHINGVRTDNRIANLREVTPSENQKNCARRNDNRSGVVGVFYSAKQRRWVAQIAERGNRYTLGAFTALEDAKAARVAAETRLGFHPNHGRAT